MDSSNFRHRVLHKLAEELALPKVTFQVIRRTIATLGRTKGHLKAIQGMMRHSKASTTTDVYMQSLEPEVRTAINAIHDELMGNGTTGPVPQTSSDTPAAPRAEEQRNIPQRAQKTKEAGPSTAKRRRRSQFVKCFGVCDKDATKSRKGGALDNRSNWWT